MSLPDGRIRRSPSIERRDPYASPEVYYAKDHGTSSLVRNRIWVTKSPPQIEIVNRRRASHGKRCQELSLPKTHAYSLLDEYAQPQKFIVNVEATLKDLLDREDTDQNHQITIDDNGPKVGLLS